ncbi:MAG: AraC family transcriptional regulator [Gammaproteobacteria bacterium]|nr:AraC family transcriptional regulator [Gammaproteobacteria bacterium]MBU1491051.1 AraC family transcriptional regulator [Gammaproteobacteria bacterium]MBU2138264.1 AraC family transcriptional regulator [Gammaproteobacteria bacterium]MBU2216638.1 AraC family transcriptional regulator [Gammaproteobacteria bacterium]MBU2322874.1 AraC family transcriptional regulator [Gammaproteobacteria bacterium]
MDPLSEVLSLLKPRSYVSAGVEAGGEWSIQFPDQNKLIKCYAVVSGECWLAVEGVPDAVYMTKGDCFVLPSGRPFRLASDMALTPEPSSNYFPPSRPGTVVKIKDGGDFFLVGSRFGVSGGHAETLMGMLPPIVHIHNETEQAALRWSVERMMQELHDPEPGSFLIAQHLAHMMLVQALRLHVKDEGGSRTGWLFGVADNQLGPAIRAIHADPAYRWTLQRLAERACMSRSAFALKFRETIGTSPMDYVTRWRMLLAGDRLENSSDSVSVISLSLGYESESAFSVAFKRVMGASPRQYGRRPAAASSARSLHINRVSQSSSLSLMDAAAD